MRWLLTALPWLASLAACSPDSGQVEPAASDPRCNVVANCEPEAQICGYDAQCRKQRCICKGLSPVEDPRGATGGSSSPADAPVSTSETDDASPTAAPPSVVITVLNELDPPVLEVMVGQSDPLRIGSQFSDCEQLNSSLDQIEGREDLRVVQLFCENGEDYFSRELMTALVHLTSPPRVLWAGDGSYANEMGVCETLDVPWFEVVDATHIRVVRDTRVVRNEQPGLGDFDCEPVPEKREVVTTVELE